jgi:hypothetical protein
VTCEAMPLLDFGNKGAGSRTHDKTRCCAFG